MVYLNLPIATCQIRIEVATSSSAAARISVRAGTHAGYCTPVTGMYTVHPGRAINWPLAACRRTSHAIHRLTCVHNGQFGTMPCLGRRTLLAPTHHSTAQCATCAALSCTLGHPTWQLMGWYSTLPATTSTRRHLPPSSGLQRIALHTAAPAAQHAGLHND